MMKHLLTIILSVWSLAVSAQLSVAVDAIPDSIYFGDEIILNYKINVPSGISLNSVDFNPLKEILNEAYVQDSINFEKIIDVDIVDGGAFGINDANLMLSQNPDGTGIPKVGAIKLRISTIGAFLLPVPNLNTTPYESAMPLQRKPLFVLPRGQAVELNPNKSIIEEAVTWRDYLKYLYGLLAAIALILLGIYLIKKMNTEEIEVEEIVEEVRRPSHVIAMEDLKKLRSQELWQNGEEKAYHTELTRVMRQYVEDRYDVQALEMTTSQVKRSMSASGIGPTIITKFVDILQIADKVKFAKGKTGPEINERFMDDAIKIVEDTRILDVQMDSGQ